MVITAEASAILGAIMGGTQVDSHLTLQATVSLGKAEVDLLTFHPMEIQALKAEMGDHHIIQGGNLHHHLQDHHPIRGDLIPQHPRRPLL